MPREQRSALKPDCELLDRPVLEVLREFQQSRPRLLGLLLVLFLLLAPPTFFGLLTSHASPPRSPQFFFEMLSGPYARLLFDIGGKASWGEAHFITLLTFSYPLYPRWFTLPLSLFGAFCWFECGVVAATGGV